ncbi:hypothetical protein [Micromonospora sp. NPDC005806]|uniref:hypothetical protein n=1 Tax=Micromonospora sp. NPDC005806 TaxID=3364234 RepID=UPI0036BBD2B6
MPLSEQIEDGRDLQVVGGHGADGQGADLPASGGGSLIDACHDLAVARDEPVAKPLAERGEPHAAAGPLEQGSADNFRSTVTVAVEAAAQANRGEPSPTMAEMARKITGALDAV